MPDFDTYLSPFSWRYGSVEMRAIWSEANKRRLWRRIWLALAEAQAEFGLVSTDQVEDIRQHVQEVDIPAALEIEAKIHHDLMAELRLFASKCPLGGGILHLGATSMDIEDNADALRLRQSLDLILERIDHLLLSLAAQAETWLEQPVMAFTHLQPAEPTTLGYRLALTAQDLLENSRELRFQRRALRGKGFKGAVGTSAAYADLFGLENLERFERLLSKALSLPFFPLATQVYPRQQDYRVLNALAGLGATLYRLAFDIRLLQSPPIGELAEPFRPGQVGSSAMPFKRNPVDAEKIDSLARLLAQYPHVAWDNAAHSLLERTLDDSANRRVILPESFLIADEILVTAIKIVDKLAIDQTAMERNLAAYGPFAATERILAALVKAGADRQEMHERLRQLSMQAWEAVRQGSENPLPELVAQDPEIRRHLSAGQLAALFDVQHHTGDAVTRAKNSIDRLREELQGENTHE